MTRANLNYIYQNMGDVPRTLFHYWNGDQYPRGLRDFYKVLTFIDGDWSIDSFKKWIHDNYEGSMPSEVKQPKIYYTDGFITDYSYIFEKRDKSIKVFEWDKKIFDGDAKRFTQWIKKQK